MRFDALDQWAPRLMALALATVAGASIAYWVMRWPAVDPSAWQDTPVAAQEGGAVGLDAPALARLLGASGPVQTAAGPVGGRWRLVGVVASRSGQGAALIAEDDQPARPYRVGSRVGEELVLQSVAHRRAMLAPSLDAPVTLTLEVPEVQADARSAATTTPTAAPPPAPPTPSAPAVSPRTGQPPAAARPAPLGQASASVSDAARRALIRPGR